MNKLDVIERDIVCQITGHGFPGSTDILKGPSVGHVIPISRADIVSNLRQIIRSSCSSNRPTDSDGVSILDITQDVEVHILERPPSATCPM